MKFFKSVLFIISSIIICLIAWLIFYWITPFIMKLSWIAMIVIFIFVGGSLIPLIGWIPGLLSCLVVKLRSYHPVEYVIILLIVLFFAFSSGRLAWTINILRGTKEIVFALFQNLLVLGVFWGIMLTLLTTEKDDVWEKSSDAL